MRFERQVFFYTVQHQRMANKEGFRFVCYVQQKDIVGLEDSCSVADRETVDRYLGLKTGRRARSLYSLLKSMLTQATLLELIAVGLVDVGLS